MSDNIRILLQYPFRTALLIITLICGFHYKTFAGSESTKHALIIAVGDYPVSSGWDVISSTNDVDIMKSALIKQGFIEEDIVILKDSFATKEGICQELENLAQNTNSGDVVVIHFSGHGQQIMDNNGNNDEIDNYDESIIPYDAKSRFNTDYKGENHLRDDELMILIDNIRKKLGDKGDLLVILDSCHSGTATRGLSKSRGTYVRFEDPEFKNRQSADEVHNEFDLVANEISTGINLSPLVVISGAKQEELNYEYHDSELNRYFGSLSYSLSKVLAKISPDATYRSLFDEVRVEMNIIAPRQSPQIEGDIDKKIFGGDAINQQKYFVVDSWINDSTLTINAGKLVGLYDGTKIGVYPPNTLNTDSVIPITYGRIINATIVEADIILEKPIEKTRALNTSVFVEEQNFGELKVRILIGKIKNRSLKQKLISEIEKNPSFILVENEPDIAVDLIDPSCRDSICLITRDEQMLTEIDQKSQDDDYIINRISKVLKNYMQAQLIKSIQIEDASLRISFEIIPVSVRLSGSRYVVDKRLDVPADFSSPGGNVTFEEGQPFLIKVKNFGYEKVFFQIIDIQSNNDIKSLIPVPGREPSEYVIEPGTQKELADIFVFAPPFGMEMFKLIGTRDPIDLSTIVSTRGVNTRAYKSPFEQLFAQSYIQTRAATLSVPPESVHVSSLLFEIQKKH